MSYVEKSPSGERYEDLSRRIADALAFMEVCGINSPLRRPSMKPSYYIA